MSQNYMEILILVPLFAKRTMSSTWVNESEEREFDKSNSVQNFKLDNEQIHLPLTIQ